MFLASSLFNWLQYKECRSVLTARDRAVALRNHRQQDINNSLHLLPCAQTPTHSFQTTTHSLLPSLFPTHHSNMAPVTRARAKTAPKPESPLKNVLKAPARRGKTKTAATTATSSTATKASVTKPASKAAAKPAAKAATAKAAAKVLASKPATTKPAAKTKPATTTAAKKPVPKPKTISTAKPKGRKKAVEEAPEQVPEEEITETETEEPFAPTEGDQAQNEAAAPTEEHSLAEEQPEEMDIDRADDGFDYNQDEQNDAAQSTAFHNEVQPQADQVVATAHANNSPIKITITTESMQRSTRKRVKRQSLIPVLSPQASPHNSPVASSTAEKHVETPLKEVEPEAPGKHPRVSTVKTVKTTKRIGKTMMSASPLKRSFRMPHNRLLEFPQPAESQKIVGPTAAEVDHRLEDKVMDQAMNLGPFHSSANDLFKTSSILSPDKKSFGSPRKGPSKPKMLASSPQRTGASSPHHFMGSSPVKATPSANHFFVAATPGRPAEDFTDSHVMAALEDMEDVEMTSPDAAPVFLASPRKHIPLEVDRSGSPHLSPKRSLVNLAEPEIIPAKETASPTKSVLRSPSKPSLRSPTKQVSPKKSVTFNPQLQEQEEPWISRPNAGLLTDCVFFVDVNTSDGDDARHLFVPLLEEMGATCVGQWTSNTDDITHVLFKDGDDRTLEKVVASNGRVQCINVGWAVE
ncbi:hypothetical protein K402DRAFT_193919 [Aulographum hederae CBS 113979]|uniref:BRCT domain-containing protein n=1 Tax=Aulographum hederae CBS 113979 TaxID=1176131 RepID=A0A6G1GP88_9PEZI|nr:hypothetical protein K402DRAFT_193919 [Aulographum hederae CBS 113979]